MKKLSLMVVSTKAGYVVQNTTTYVVVAGPYQSREQAAIVLNNLSK
jgi:cell division protein FtsN